MGACFSSRSSLPFDCVRVIHINGYVEDFDAPVTAGQVTGNPPKHMLCSSAQLLSFGSMAHFRPDDVLEPGRLYFLLPHSVLQSDSSPVDLASLVTRLTALARVGPDTATSLSGKVGDARPNGLLGGCGRGGRMASRARTWTPELSTIKEGSMERLMVRDSSNNTDSTCELR